MRYEISKKTVDSLGRNEWVRIDEKPNKQSAIVKAIKLSMKEKTEFDVIGFDVAGDVCFHAFYENGKMTNNMSV